MNGVFPWRRQGVAATVLAMITVIVPQVSLLAQWNVAPDATMRFPIYVPLVFNEAVLAQTEKQGDVPSAALAVRQVLAQKLGIEPVDIIVLDFEHVDWPDSCLGAARDAASPAIADAVVCAAVITPGYRIVLEACGDPYVYHTNQDGSQFRLVESPQGVVGKVIVLYTAANVTGLCSATVGVDDMADTSAHIGLDNPGEGSPSPTIIATGLTDANWCATRYATGAGGSQNVLAGTALTVRFDIDGHVSGHAGCNSYGGAYAADGTSLAILGLASTRQTCAADVILQEQAYFAALQRAARYRHSSGSLCLFGPSDSGSLTFSPLGR